MFFKNAENLNSHDYFNVIVKVYPKLKKYINNILNAFELNIDASNYFVEYFSDGHGEIHLILGDEYPCSRINIFLNDLLFSVIKFDRNNINYDVPDLFYNFHAVHYYHKIKGKIYHLNSKGMGKAQIIDFLILWERDRHQKKECDCGENHELLGTNQLRELFLLVLKYFYSVNTNHYQNTLDENLTEKNMGFLN
tara:strand:+ start:1264 stop:1845 length:582 start_codon:yes stop_codon:yes gene_type:complete